MTITCGLECLKTMLVCLMNHIVAEQNIETYYPKHAPFTADFQGPKQRVKGLPGLEFVFWVHSISRLQSRVTEWHQGQLVVKNALKVHNGLRHQGLNPKGQAIALIEFEPRYLPTSGGEVPPPLLWPDTFI